MEFCEKWGTDVETAVGLALAELKATKEEVDVEVLEEPSRGFFGIGSKLALVRVTRKQVSTPKPAKEERAPQEERQKQEAKSDRIEGASAGRGGQRKQNQRDNRSGRDGRVRKDVDYESHAGSDISLIVDKSTLTPLEEHAALTFLTEVTEKMGLEVTLKGMTDGENIYVDMEGKDSGTIIGKRGQTLDAIQYLTSLVVNKDNSEYVRVVVDAENYRAKRERTLERLAKRLADKVVRSRRSVKLEPMNPYERKVIHAALQGDRRVTTRSEGQDPYRRVIIELK